VAESIYVGDARTVFATFHKDTGAVGDPATVTLTVRKPDGTPATYTAADFAHVGASGYYSVVIVMDQPGRWRFRWLGVGGDVTSEAIEFGLNVIRSLVTA
jgi:protocatechuate 3,4-dioxygenase beta subunit